MCIYKFFDGLVDKYYKYIFVITEKNRLNGFRDMQ